MWIVEATLCNSFIEEDTQNVENPLKALFIGFLLSELLPVAAFSGVFCLSGLPQNPEHLEFSFAEILRAR